MGTDKTLTCKDCGAKFTFSASEQEFFAEKGFTNEPTRCSSCRAAKRNSGARTGHSASHRSENRAERVMYDVVCDGCGVTTQVPFKPRGDRPIYCRDCFNDQKGRYAKELSPKY